jgi:hypothetical protein
VTVGGIGVEALIQHCSNGIQLVGLEQPTAGGQINQDRLQCTPSFESA